MSLTRELESPSRFDLLRLHRAVESMDQIVFLLAPDLSRVLYVNAAYERITGYSCESLQRDQCAWTDSIHADDRAQVVEAVNNRRSGEIQGRSQLEYRIRRSDGETRWLRAMLTPATDEAGETDCLVGLAEDITHFKEAEMRVNAQRDELARAVQLRTDDLLRTVTRLEEEIEQRKQVETELKRSEALFRSLFEDNIVGVLFADIYGNITDANRAFLDMTGYSRSDLPLRWDTMTAPEWSHISNMVVQNLIQAGSARPFEKEYFRKDGTRFPALVSVTVLDRATWRCVAFVLDLTARKQAEGQVREVSAQLEQASRLSVMGEMVADLAHEIHQPLAVIANYANGSLLRVKKGQMTFGELKRRLKDISRESMRGAKIVKRVREFIRLREPERKPVDLNIVVLEALQLTRPERREHHVAVIVQLHRDLPRVWADAVQMTQVLVNLLLNAIQALGSLARERRKILVGTYVNDAGLVEVSVADNGPGIEVADQSRIFDRFFTTKTGGLGLGLAISRSIIESHGGQLWYDSVPGESALFRLTLPVHKACDATPDQHSVDRPSADQPPADQPSGTPSQTAS